MLNIVIVGPDDPMPARAIKDNTYFLSMSYYLYNICCPILDYDPENALLRVKISQK